MYNMNENMKYKQASPLCQLRVNLWVFLRTFSLFPTLRKTSNSCNFALELIEVVNLLSLVCLCDTVLLMVTTCQHCARSYSKKKNYSSLEDRNFPCEHMCEKLSCPHMVWLLQNLSMNTGKITAVNGLMVYSKFLCLPASHSLENWQKLT